MAEDRLMPAAECKAKGYADEMTPAIPMAATFSISKLPEKHRAALAAMFTSTSEATAAEEKRASHRVHSRARRRGEGRPGVC
jgi:hypothetical protein